MKNYLEIIFKDVITRLNIPDDVPLIFDTPKSEAHGDLATNLPLLLTKKLKRNPMEIGTEICNALSYDKEIIEKVELVKPGFVNIFFTAPYITGIIQDIHRENERFGTSSKYSGKTANVEFVSANPTGPLTVGHGRNAVCGDTIANMLEWVGYDVTREYYFNNAGRQMRVLGDSVRLRYLELCGEAVMFPEDYYQGEYIREIAARLEEKHGDDLMNEPAEGKFKDAAESEIFELIKVSLERLGIKHKIFYNENTLYTDGRIDGLLNKFKEMGVSYEKDGAVWFRFSEAGNEQDKVIVKSTGEPTYRLPDIAYHVTKFERNYDLIVDLFGSDHAATYPDVLAALRILGYDVSKVKVLIHQFVTIMQGNEVIKMSTRKANYITLDELIDEAGSDVVRFFFNMLNLGTHMNFDLELAKKHSDENPVFYLQYAHARICSIIRTASEAGLSSSLDNIHLLILPDEQRLIKILHRFPEEMLTAADTLEPGRIASYLKELAAAFHRFYVAIRIIGSEKETAEARLAMAEAVKTVIKNGLGVLGVSAPERM
ncbi:MAG: arginine--tRNA ligase [Ignavibacteriaceae bacterium]|nr:arginine--tRNA ligase [Ignavibacteriaceae bacterium]